MKSSIYEKNSKNSVSLSVIIPCYNASKTLERALLSVARQTILPEQVIIIDDCSQDVQSIIEIVNKFENDFEINTIFLRNLENRGVSFTRNRGMKIADTDYLAFLDADDTWTEEKIAVQYNFMCKNNIDITAHYSTNKGSKTNVKRNKNITFNKLLVKNFIATRSVMLSRTIYKNYFFDETMRYSEDFDLWLRISKKYSIVLIGRFMATYYDNIFDSGLSSKLTPMHKSLIKVYKKNLNNSFLTFILVYFYLTPKLIFRFLRKNLHKYLKA